MTQDVTCAAGTEQHDGHRVGDDVMQFACDGRALPLRRDLVQLVSLTLELRRPVLDGDGVAMTRLRHS